MISSSKELRERFIEIDTDYADKVFYGIDWKDHQKNLKLEALMEALCELLDRTQPKESRFDVVKDNPSCIESCRYWNRDAEWCERPKNSKCVLVKE